VTTHRTSVLPGFHLSLGLTLLWLGPIVLLPLFTLLLKAGTLGPGPFWDAVTAPRVLAATRLSLGASFAAAATNLLFGTLLAWALVRYEFPGRRTLDALVDLPFALPTAVSGLALATLWSETGWLGGLVAPLGLKVAYARAGIVVALVMIGLPFVVRTVQPALATLGPELEEAAATLGATRTQTLLRVVLPTLAPSLVTGFTLAFARAVGEYGSVVFIAGNVPMQTEIAPLLIIAELEQYDYGGAAAVATLMLATSLAALLAINGVEAWRRRVWGEAG
jgi:sulfate transport system permease protein